MTYAEKLKDPRWQKRRLEILERDEWCCQRCFDGDSTLHVHHMSYSGDPWDVPAKDLITLCDECHQREMKETRRAIEDKVILSLRRHLLCDELIEFLWMLENPEIPKLRDAGYGPCNAVHALEWLLHRPKYCNRISERQFRFVASSAKAVQ